MKIKLLKPWGMSAVGDILTDVNKPVADLLIERGTGELVKPKQKRAKKCSNGK
jgi:hypothetical protein